MSAADTVPPDSNSNRSRWWLEPELLLILLIASMVHGARLTELTLRGEETRRALVAREMLESGDWIVPTQQGELFLSRPPMGSWLMALVALAHGSLDTFAIRLPSVLATIVMTLVIYAYSRHFMGRLGALGASLAFCTMFEVMHLGRLGESDAVFTFFVACSLLLWHLAYVKRVSPWRMWAIGYTIAAAATLTKGPQGIIFFGAATWLFLIVRGEGKLLLSKANVFGFVLFGVLYGAWQIPCLYMVGDQAASYFTTELGYRFEDRSLSTFLEHLALFPLNVLGSLLPWSLLLLAYLLPSVRRSSQAGTDRNSSLVAFLVISIAVTFPMVWLPPGGRTRYFMPLYPLFAVLIGIVIEQLVEQALARDWSVAFRRVTAAFAGVGIVAALGYIALAIVAPTDVHPMLAPSLELGVASGLTIIGFSTLSLAAGRVLTRRRAELVTAATACVLGIVFTGPFLEGRMAVSEDIKPSITEVRRKVPALEPFVSLGILHHKFAFEFPDRIPVVAWPAEISDLPEEVEYFCFHKNNDDPIQLPFNWELLAVVNCDRNHSDNPFDRVIVGRKIPMTVVTEPTTEQTR